MCGGNIFRVRFVITALLAALVFTGCSKTALGVYDPSVPSAELCTLEIEGAFTVTEFDQKSVEWFGWPAGATIQIPAGDHTLKMDYATSSNDGKSATFYTAGGIVLRHTFEAGKTYLLYPEVYGNRVSAHIAEVER